MEILVFLIIVSIVIAGIFLVLFIWSVKSGQYDDIDAPAMRIFYEHRKSQKQNKKKTKV